MEWAKIIIQAGIALIEMLVDAFESNDTEKVKRVSEILPKDSPLRAELVAEAERKKTYDELQSKP